MYMYYYEVAPIRIIRAGNDVFTYSSDDVLPIGSITQVEIGSRLITAVIITEVSQPTYATKPIKKIISGHPLPQPLLETALWMASYYHTPVATVLQTVLPRGLDKTRRQRDKSLKRPSRKRTNFVLNKDQSTALNSIIAMDSGPALLHGVTGSGKTRVYIEAVRHMLVSGKSAIVLVPEISLTSQLVDEFQHEFGDILVTHSRQTEAERHLAWQDALDSTTPRVAIGPRSALFMPLASIGLIIIDEAHEPSYKQEQSPRYHATLVASVLTKKHTAKLVLGSATPLVSDYYLALASHRPILTMPQPAAPNTTKPVISLIDMTKRDNFTTHRLFSDAMLASITKTLAAGHQALVYHNRRGTALTTLCENCGWQAGCPRCFIPLTLHADTHELVCHICHITMPVPTSCPECGHVDIIHKGIGTKQIESELQKLFTKKTIMRFDGDTAAHETVDRQYAKLYDGSIDIIIGTQVVAKGLDLPNLRSVSVVQADSGLSLPDYTAPERTFQLLAQVIGRVGRSPHATHVTVQSYQPGHPAIRDALEQDYDEFYQRTIAQRRHTLFPPFRFLLKLVCTYKTEATTVHHAAEFAQKLKTAGLDIEILGPTPAFYERVRDTYRWQLVVRSAHRSELLKVVDLLPSKNWQFELDPLSLL